VSFSFSRKNYPLKQTGLLNLPKHPVSTTSHTLVDVFHNLLQRIDLFSPAPDRLTGGGKEIQCGWLKDKFGIPWQIVPGNLPELIIKNPKAMQAMMGMKKINLAELERAANC
jgi:predicted 3-demethylubiquinone-9 3-methyltransferase (glyoxalase superfamily)